MYSSEDYIFMESLKRQYGKLSTNELDKCFQPNPIQKVWKENVPTLSYITGNDCESTLFHPSSQNIPLTCEVRLLKLKTYWIPLSLSNQWLFVTPNPEKLSVICDVTKQVEIKQKGKLTLQQQRKDFTTYVTLYTVSTNIVNVSQDFVHTIPLDFDCCLTFERSKEFEDIPLSVPLSNILAASADDLRLASHKVDEVEQTIKEQEMKDYLQWYKHVTSGRAVVSFIVFIVLSCCCCKNCRSCWFKIRDKWTPKTCWKETSERLCINITNVQDKQPHVIINITNVQGKLPTFHYSKTAHSSPPPTRSLTSSPSYSASDPSMVTSIAEDDNKEMLLRPSTASLRHFLR
jgi:hypothetical protein